MSLSAYYPTYLSVCLSVCHTQNGRRHELHGDGGDGAERDTEVLGGGWDRAGDSICGTMHHTGAGGKVFSEANCWRQEGGCVHMSVCLFAFWCLYVCLSVYFVLLTLHG